ncbi:MAG: hypothetical protein KY053_00075 [Candidatus Liptonbacteria bacterium]|nr:hypothetical protein [Candidatus Liptonbacteria bacterium]
MAGKLNKKEELIGVVVHYYGKAGVAVIKFNRDISKKEEVCFRGPSTDFSQKIDSIQRDHKDIEMAPKNKEVGVKVKERVREGDEVYKTL